MSERQAAAVVKPAAKPAAAPSRGVVQRQCACGQHASNGGECESCKRKRLEGVVQRAPANASTHNSLAVDRDYSQVPTRIRKRTEPVIQPKLIINQPGDIYEQEADRIASRVMSTETHPDTTSAPLSIQRLAGSPFGITDRTPASINSTLSSPGTPLEPSLRQSMEQRFGYDFSQVRVHSGPTAEKSAQDINALAYTVGRDIVFGSGEFAPATQEGQRLLAHELTHVVQQSGAEKTPIGPDPYNRDISPLTIPDDSNKRIMRKGFESTINICHRELTSRNFEVTNGGVRVVFILNPLDKDVPNCEDHKFWVTLTKSRDWWPDDDIASCELETGGTKSISFGDISSGTYYLTIGRAFDNPYCCLDGDIMVFDELIQRDSSTCERDKDPSALDIVHGALDIAGFIPVLGAIPDGINAGIYAVEGDWENAGLSAVAMVPLWGDGVKLGAVAGKTAIKVSKKAAIRLGEEGIAKGLKEVKAASELAHAAKLEKEAAQAAKLEKEAAGQVEKEAAGKLEKNAAEKGQQEAAEKAEKEAAEKKKKEKSGSGKWTCYGRSAVLQIPSELPEIKCPLDGQYVDGPPVSAPSEEAACLAAKHAFNAMMPRGCRPKHLACRCSKR